MDTTKIRAQVKSKWYYIFWGIATTSVVAGQILVGTGYRQMAQETEKINNTLIKILIGGAIRQQIEAPDAAPMEQQDQYTMPIIR
tara:strand:- start:6670 stop:6924 length:255 start_codon:yes stop_codon:yes gene_type:complete